MKNLIRNRIAAFILTAIGIFSKRLLPFLSILLLTACQKGQLETISPPPNLEVIETSSSTTSLSVNTSNTLQVSGTIVEEAFQFTFNTNGVTMTATNSWNGSLTGSGRLHIFSTETVDLSNAYHHNVISKRFLFTPDGNLFFDEVGESNGAFVSVTSTVIGGTGIYKKATGQLILSGIHTEEGVDFTYSGSINLGN